MRDQRVYQEIWVLEGEMEVSLADEIHRLREGDCLAMPLDRPAVPQPDAQTGTLRGRDRLYAHGATNPLVLAKTYSHKDLTRIFGTPSNNFVARLNVADLAR